VFSIVLGLLAWLLFMATEAGKVLHQRALAIIKLGADGALLATATERVRIPAIPVDVVCGLGAGDAFGGSLCLGLLNEWSLDRIGLYANAAGALVSTRLTCADAMPRMDELVTLVGEAA
jgi:5-dehydro-2-deoxygluconokinase